VIFLFLCVAGFVGCRSKRKTDVPRTVPPAETARPSETPAEPVVSQERDFVAPAAERDVLSEDIAEANRTARERGWIRDAFFAFDASTLDAEAQAALRASATWLREHPQFGLLIEGHCDDRGTEQYNLALGDRRADTAKAFVSALGIDAARIRTVSYGEDRPFESGETEEAWAQNRRAHLVLVRR
jgi:peptidoglycan-associated lipoprotein